MKRWFKKKHQESTSEDRGGDTAEKQEELVKDEEESVGTNPQTQTLFPEECVTSEESEPDVQSRFANFLCCGPFLRKTDQPVECVGSSPSDLSYPEARFQPRQRFGRPTSYLTRGSLVQRDLSQQSEDALEHFQHFSVYSDSEFSYGSLYTTHMYGSPNFHPGTSMGKTELDREDIKKPSFLWRASSRRRTEPVRKMKQISPSILEDCETYGCCAFSEHELTKAEDHDEQKPFLPFRMAACSSVLHFSSDSSSVYADPLVGASSYVQSETEPEVQLQGETEPLVTTKHFPVTNTQTSSSHLQFPKTDSSETRETSRPLPRSHSVSSLRPATCADTKIIRRSQSLPELKLRSSFEDFTPDISVDEDDETYRFQFSCPGLYQCTVTGLVFDMEGEGDVVYRTVPWNRRLLSQHHKKPAGPLFDIKCVQQSVCQLHVPHCEILSTGGFQFLSVAHVTDEGIEFIRPQKITETHVVINITGFSGYGNVKDEDSPPDPVRALVLLFYRPPEDPDPKSFLNVLLVPRNIVLKELFRTRRDERHIETSPHCKLQPNQFYTLSTRPQNRPVKIEPPEAEFDDEFHSSYFTTFQVILKTTIKDIKLVLKQKSSSNTVWKREVYLPSTTERNSCAQFALKPPPNQRLRNIQSPMSTGNRKSSEEKLLDVRSRFVDGISEPVLKCLLDKLLEKKVMNDSERESMNEKQNRRDKARFVIDTVRKKGEAASSEMIECLCELDTFFCDHLGLM